MATTWVRSGARTAQATQATTETAPTDTTVGVELAGTDAVMPVLKAPQGQTFTGVGTLLAYHFAAGRWVRKPLWDRDLSNLNGLAEGALDEVSVVLKSGFLIWIPSGVGLSLGAVVVTDYVCSIRDGSPPA